MQDRFSAERENLMKDWDNSQDRVKVVSEANVKLKALVGAIREKVNILEKENSQLWLKMSQREKEMQDTIEKWRNGKWIDKKDTFISDNDAIGKVENKAIPKVIEKKEYVGVDGSKNNIDDQVT
jgi:predicted nuclease with TOPRIM domain